MSGVACVLLQLALLSEYGHPSEEHLTSADWNSWVGLLALAGGLPCYRIDEVCTAVGINNHQHWLLAGQM
jgi:hypothetical protein